MNPRPRRLVALLGLGFLLGSCSLRPESPPNPCAGTAALINPEGDAQTARAPGIGGTGQMAGLPGIGGTGQAQTRADSGIGGTGIVGVVTGFASICVNGEEIHYTPATPVLRDGEPGSTRDLQVGQVVAVDASARHSDSGAQWQARQIVVQHAVIGPITQLDIPSGRFSVLGEAAQTLSREDLAGRTPGDWVRVSGHRQADGVIQAGRVQALPSATTLAQVQGPVSAIHDQTLQVGSTAVRFATLPAGLQAGSEILVRGQWDGQQLHADSSRQHPTQTAIQHSSSVLLQGYVHELRENELHLGYERLVLPAPTPENSQQRSLLTRDQPVLVRGHRDAAQRLVADQVTIADSRHDKGQRGGFSFGQGGRGNAQSGNHGGRGNGGSDAAASGGGHGGGNGGNGGGGGGGNGGGGR